MAEDLPSKAKNDNPKKIESSEAEKTPEVENVQESEPEKNEVKVVEAQKQEQATQEQEKATETAQTTEEENTPEEATETAQTTEEEKPTETAEATQEQEKATETAEVTEEEKPAETAEATQEEEKATETAKATQEQEKATETAEAQTQVAQQNGLKLEDIQVGEGQEAQSGKKVSVHYTGWLTNGKKFDSSVDRGTPFQFTLGARQVIQGWDQGVLGMKVGGKRKLTIPPALGYGERGSGEKIPPNATLVFEVELIEVKQEQEKPTETAETTQEEEKTAEATQEQEKTIKTTKSKKEKLKSKIKKRIAKLKKTLNQSNTKSIVKLKIKKEKNLKKYLNRLSSLLTEKSDPIFQNEEKVIAREIKITRSELKYINAKIKQIRLTKSDSSKRIKRPRYTSNAFQLSTSFNAFSQGYNSIAANYEFQPISIQKYQKYGILSLGLALTFFHKHENNGIKYFTGLGTNFAFGARARYQFKYKKNQILVPSFSYEYQKLKYFINNQHGWGSLSGISLELWLLLNTIDQKKSDGLYKSTSINNVYLTVELRNASASGENLDLSDSSIYWGLRFEF